MLPVKLGSRTVSLLWVDLFRIVVVHVQILQLLWAQSCFSDKPWPRGWCSVSQALWGINQDWWSLRAFDNHYKKVSVWQLTAPNVTFPGGVSPDLSLRAYTATMVWTTLPLMAAVVWVFCWVVLRAKRVSSLYGPLHALGGARSAVCVLAKGLLFLGSLLYLPYCVNVARALACPPDSSPTWFASALYTCGGSPLELLCGASHCGGVFAVVFLVLQLVFACGCVLGWPLLLARCVSRQVVFTSPSEHEHWLQGREMEWLLRVGYYASSPRFFCFAAYRRSFYAYQAVHSVFLAFVVSAVTLLHEYPLSQAVVVTSLLFCWQTLCLFRRPFRSVPCHAVDQCLGWANVFNATTVLCLAADFRNPLLISANLQALLATVNIIVSSVSLAVVIFCLAFCRAWPMSLNTARRQARHLPGAVDAINRARSIISSVQDTTPLLVDVTPIRSQLRGLHRLVVRARRKNHPLLYALEDTLLDLEVHYYGVSDVTVLPRTTLQALLPALTKKLQEREQRLVLVGPRKRRVLIKLLAVGAFSDILTRLRLPQLREGSDSGSSDSECAGVGWAADGEDEAVFLRASKNCESSTSDMGGEAVASHDNEEGGHARSLVGDDIAGAVGVALSGVGQAGSRERWNPRGSADLAGEQEGLGNQIRETSAQETSLVTPTPTQQPTTPERSQQPANPESPASPPPHDPTRTQATPDNSQQAPNISPLQPEHPPEARHTLDPPQQSPTPHPAPQSDTPRHSALSAPVGSPPLPSLFAAPSQQSLVSTAHPTQQPLTTSPNEPPSPPNSSQQPPSDLSQRLPSDPRALSTAPPQQAPVTPSQLHAGDPDSAAQPPADPSHDGIAPYS